MDVSRGTWKLQLPGKYDSASQDIDACDHSLDVSKSKLNGILKLIQAFEITTPPPGERSPPKA